MERRPAPELAWQESLFDVPCAGGEPRSFDGLVRHHLDDRSWVDEVTGWVPDHAERAAWLVDQAPWRQGTRRMWGVDVAEPRLTATWPQLGDAPPQVAELAAPLSERYGVTFDSCHVNLYRSGADAVAWHADTVRTRLVDPLVVTVSLGVRRPFLLRPAAGGPVAHRFAPGEGDLLVMGGACQHDWHHTVPRARDVVGARISVTFRHSAPLRHPPP